MSAASVTVCAVLLDMYCLGPVLFYDDLVMKRDILAGWSMAGSAFMTPILSVFSLTDTSWTFRMNLLAVPRFQAGLLLLASYVAFVYFHGRRPASWALPFAITGGLALYLTVRPAPFLLPPLKYADIAQFSYRLLSVFTLAGTIAGALALKAFFRSGSGIAPESRSVAVLALIALSLAMVVPYVYPRAVNDRFAQRLDTAEIYRLARLRYGEDAYLRMPPSEEAVEWVGQGRKAVAGSGKAGDWTFRVELEDYYRSSAGPAGEVLLDVLYYPGLQDVEILTDRVRVRPRLGTYWQRRDSLRGADESLPGIFHGLRIIGAPEKGVLEVRVRFTGYRWANWTSLAVTAFLLVGAGCCAFRRRAGRRARGARFFTVAAREPDDRSDL